jgi:glucose uptake protein
VYWVVAFAIVNPSKPCVEVSTKAGQLQDYSIGVLLLALLFAFTLGSAGDAGRAFLPDVSQADAKWLGSAFLGGVIFNLSNILLVAAIDIAGLAVAFPVGVGLALVLGVVTTYLATGSGSVPMLAGGVSGILVAIILDAIAYKRLTSASRELPTRGIVLSVVGAALMGWFYSFVAQAIGVVDPITHALTPGKLSPYTAIVSFSLGLFLSSFLWNSIAMRKPFHGEPVSYRDYFTQGNARLHGVGILGGAIWNVGMGLNIIASTKAGPALYLWPGTRRDNDRGDLGRIHLERIQGSAARHRTST